MAYVFQEDKLPKLISWCRAVSAHSSSTKS